MKFIVAIALLIVLIAAVLMLVRPSGPRITTIEHRRDDRDKPEDGDDA